MILKWRNKKFHQHKRPILINNIDINKIVVSNKFPFGKQHFKYLIGYKDQKEISKTVKRHTFLCLFWLYHLE